MTNNDILKKLRVALKLRNDEIIAIMKLVGFNATESELGAIFRHEDHPKYKNCGDQFLRNFLNGLVIHMRGPMEEKKIPDNGQPRGDGHDRPKAKNKAGKALDSDAENQSTE